MTDAPRYVIRTLDDFARVPAGRLAACLEEFAVAVEIQRTMCDLMNAVAGEMVGPEANGAIAVRPLSFTWVDDGARNMAVNILTPTPHAAWCQSRFPMRGAPLPCNCAGHRDEGEGEEVL